MKRTITFTEELAGELRRAVLAVPGVEGAAYVLCGRVELDGEQRLLAREIVPVEDAEYLVREPWRLSIASPSYVRVAKRARMDGLSVLFSHSHPQGPYEFSAQDDREEPKLMQFFDDRAGSDLHGSVLVTDRPRLHGRAWRGGRWHPIDTIRVIGQRFAFHDREDPTAAALPSAFDRNVRAFGREVQQLLRRRHVGVVGAGGLGSAVAVQLARLGVGRISIFDGDSLDATNLGRVYGSRMDAVGQNKAELLAAHVRAMGLETQVDAWPIHITDETTARRLRSCEVVFGCTDKELPRLILCRLANQYVCPVIDTAVKIDSLEERLRGVYGRVTTLFPGAACLLCRERITPTGIAAESLTSDERAARARDGYAPELDVEDPAVVAFTTAVAAQAIAELLHRLTGFQGSAEFTESLLLFHDCRVSRNLRAPIDCVCTERRSWAVGDRDRDGRFLGLTW